MDRIATASFALAALFALSGCAPTLVGENSRGGTIQHVIDLNKGEALERANAACKTYGRVARVNQYDVLDSSLSYDCVEP